MLAQKTCTLKRWLWLVLMGGVLLLAQQGAWRHALVHTAHFLQEPRTDTQHLAAVDDGVCDACLAFSASANAAPATWVFDNQVYIFADWQIQVTHTPRVAQTWVYYRSRAPPAFA
jgi:hypothetical protein